MFFCDLNLIDSEVIDLLKMKQRKLK